MNNYCRIMQNLLLAINSLNTRPTIDFQTVQNHTDSAFSGWLGQDPAPQNMYGGLTDKTD